MGLSKKRSNVTYLTVRNGEMIMRVKEATDTSVARVITKGKHEGTTVNEELFDALDGKIVAVYKRESDVSFQPDKYVTLEIVIEDDDGDVFQVTIPYSSGYSKGFFTRIEAVNLLKVVDLRTYWIKGDDDKERGFLGILQEGEKIEPLYSRNDGVLPSITPIKKGEKIIAYDDDDLLAFYDSILSKVEVALKGAAPKKEEEVSKEEVEETPAEEVHEDSPQSGQKKF